MTAQQAKQVVKNALYRTIGETSTALGLQPEAQTRRSASSCTTRSTTCPTTRRRCRCRQFDEQLVRLGELGYNVVDLDAVLDHYTPRHAAAREGGADHLRRRLSRHARERAAGAAARTATRR